MLRAVMTVALSTLILGLAACGGSSTTTTADIVVSDTPSDARDIVGHDTPDTYRPDVVANDVVQDDTVAIDTVDPDVVVTDTVVTDTVVTDTNPGDVVVTGCSGACNSATDAIHCLEGGTTICVCASDSNTWTPYVCADVCAANFMVGDQCVEGTDGADCGCTNDCANATLVSGQCENTAYTECTCGAADPCQWLGDAYCDSPCVTLFPDDHFTDTADCACSGACDAAQFQGYCTLDGKACGCPQATQATLDCVEFCTSLDASAGACDPQQGMCVCENYSCADPAKVTAQCEAGVYSPCTCAVADVCAWANDEYCDSPACNSTFPNQANFDDSATAACTQG